MELSVFTTNNADEAEAMRVKMVMNKFTIVVCDEAELISIKCENLEGGSTASGLTSWVVIGKK